MVIRNAYVCFIVVVSLRCHVVANKCLDWLSNILRFVTLSLWLRVSCVDEGIRITLVSFQDATAT